MAMNRVNKYFGTDGIRGQVGQSLMSVEFVLKLGWAIGRSIQERGGETVLIGKDTRISGYMLESALEAGLSAAGINILLVGPLPSSGVAYLTKAFRADAGILITASHNSCDDNGIKVFDHQGFKISRAEEQRIEFFLDQPLVTASLKTLGRAYRINDAPGRYIEFCKGTVKHSLSLRGFKIVIDCANGAAYQVAPSIFRELGATVIALNVAPDGLNINDHAGSLHPEVIQQAVLKHKADIGIALDGDADRVVLADHMGELLDGDDILCILAQGLTRDKKLRGGVVGTDMSNGALALALNTMQVNFSRSEVGDHNVLQMLKEKDWDLGGEPSGHIIYLPLTTSSDGIITALQVLQTLIVNRLNLHEFKKAFKKHPQLTQSIIDKNRSLNLERKDIQSLIENERKKLGANSRILVRYSGTEPVLRIMVEGDEIKKAEGCLKRLVNVLSNFIKAPTKMPKTPLKLIKTQEEL